MTRKKVFNDFLPSMEVEGSFNHPKYSFDLKIPVSVSPVIYESSHNDYDCLIDPFSTLLDIIRIASNLF